MASPHDAPQRQHHLLLAGGIPLPAENRGLCCRYLLDTGVSGTSTNRISLLAKKLYPTAAEHSTVWWAVTDQMTSRDALSLIKAPTTNRIEVAQSMMAKLKQA